MPEARRKNAYTMLEMAAVLLILMVMVSLAVGVYHSGEAVDAAQHGEMLHELSTMARLAAIRTGQETAVVFLPEQRKWTVTGSDQELPLPEGVELYLDDDLAPPDGEELRLLEIRPDGWASAPRKVELRQGPLTIRVGASGLTGAVIIAEPPGEDPVPIWMDEE